ncbi:MAG: class I SAM-dependent methyltransferase [Proteobacteria bacterium]|nr:class I SAM-dependent methyltransferase [Pseudomonadota bacterium]MBU1740188.1 class I SAM-dependent methyltransferase [Pseudomonadota bacterium]
MNDHVCPWWVGYLFVNPIRRFLENPQKILGPYVQSGMVVLEPGCGMGYFTLPLARMVGPTGRVVVVDIQERMLQGLERRARRAGLLDRIERRLSPGQGLGLDDLAETVDFATAIYVVHEVPDQDRFFKEVRAALKPGGRLLVKEPKGHVKPADYDQSLALARDAGFEKAEQSNSLGARVALLVKA